jgi:hypothetical protein
MSSPDDYALKLHQQQEQYKSGAEIIRELPGIFHYWSNRYVLPQLQAAFGASTITEVYAKPLLKLAGAHERCCFVSIGCGDCTQEIRLARYLLEHGFSTFEILGLDVAEELIKKGLKAGAQSIG